MTERQIQEKWFWVQNNWELKKTDMKFKLVGIQLDCQI